MRVYWALKEAQVRHILVKPNNPSGLAERCGKQKPTGCALGRDRIPPSFFSIFGFDSQRKLALP